VEPQIEGLLFETTKQPMVDCYVDANFCGGFDKHGDVLSAIADRLCNLCQWSSGQLGLKTADGDCTEHNGG
jgi:hypothetical protein